MDLGKDRFRLLNRILRRDPDDDEANRRMGLSHLRRENTLDVVPHTEKGAAQSKDASLARLGRGIIHRA